MIKLNSNQVLTAAFGQPIAEEPHPGHHLGRLPPS